MINELTIYNLSIKYPNTIDLVREVEKMARADVIEEFAEDMLNKIVFEEKWLFNCKSNNADTNIMISALKTCVKSKAEQLKEQSNESS